MTLTRRDFSKRLFLYGAAAGLGGTAAGYSALRLGQRPPRVEHYAVRHPGLPAALAGFRILLVSDVHAGANMDEERMQRIVAGLQGLEPDLVVLAGDMVDASGGRRDARAFASAFAALTGRSGAVFVPGNHDHKVGIRRLARLAEEARLTFLRDAVHTVEHCGATLAILGVDDPRVEEFDPPQDEAVARVASRLPEGAFPVMVAHRPAAFDAAPQHGIPLTLSGHTHGGQIAVPGTGLTPVRLVTRYVRGHYRSGKSHLIVSSGVGTGGLPLRTGVPPSVSLITLAQLDAAA